MQIPKDVWFMKVFNTLARSKNVERQSVEISLIGKS